MTDTPSLVNTIDLFDYFAYSGGALLPFSRFYLDIYQTCMVDHHQELDTYVLNHNLNSRALLAQLLLTERFNYLSIHPPKTALAQVNPTD